MLTPVLSLRHIWLIALHHSSKDQSHPRWPFSRCLLGLQWCPLFVDLGSQAFLGFASKKKKKIYSGRWYMFCDRRVGLGESYSKINIWKKLVGKEKLEALPHLGYVQGTNGASSRKACNIQMWEIWVLCKWPRKSPESHGLSLSEYRPFSDAWSTP